MLRSMSGRFIRAARGAAWAARAGSASARTVESTRRLPPEARDGQYTRALASGCEVSTLLFETLGGFSPDVVALLKRLADERENRLTKAEYDETTWSARTWQSFATQQISVALQLAATLEIAHALGIATA